VERKVKVAWPALKEAGIKLYDHMGIAMFFSLLWLFMGVAPLFLVYPLLVEAWLLGGLVLVLVSALLFVPTTCAVWEMCRRLRDRQDAGGRAFFRAFGAYYKRAFVIGLADGFLFLVLAADLYFAFKTGNKFFQFMGGIWIWFGVFLVLMQIYLFPLLVDGNSVKKTFKKAALLVLDNLGNSLLILLETVAVLFLSLLLPPLLVLFFPVMVGFLHTEAYRIIMTKYDLEEDEDADQVAGS
jgi:uncharacterized membrane protein YesL